MFKVIEELPLKALYSRDITIKLEILNALYREYNGYTIESLSHKINVSKKTIYKYIKELNELSINSSENTAFVLDSDSNNYTFLGNKIEFLELRYRILESCDAIKLLLELVHASSINFLNFCAKYYISESTLKNIIRKINYIFKFIDIRLSVKKNEIFLNGNEVIIRYCFTSILWRIYNGLKFPFELMDKEIIQKLKDDLFKNLPLSISEGRKNLFLYLLLVNATRAHNNKLSSSLFPNFYKELTGKSDILVKLAATLHNYFKLSTVELEFNLILLYTFPEFYQFEDKLFYTLNILEKKAPCTFYNIISFLIFIKKKHPTWDINSENGRNLLSHIISSYISVFLFKHAYFNLQDLNLLKFSYDNFPTLLPTIQKNIVRSTSNTQEGIIKSLTFRLTQAYLVEFSPMDFEPEINIMLITDSPPFVEKRIILKLNSILATKYNIKISTEISNLNQTDLIISTDLYVNLYSESTSQIPKVFIFPQIEERDKFEILEACKIIHEKKINLLDILN